MSQSEKAELYRALKDAGVSFPKHYREYSTEDFQVAWAELQAQRPELPQHPAPAREPEAPMAGAQHYKEDEAPLRVDKDTGIIWYREEVSKPATAQPRRRRILRYIDPGVQTQTAKDGGYTETFEVAGKQSRSAEVRITMPSYQVGVYKDPRFPFKVHSYNNMKGFDLFDVENFYGGADMVPAGVKRIYVQNVLCYDMRTVVREIQREARELQLKGQMT